jgi:hypothetical protein
MQLFTLLDLSYSFNKEEITRIFVLCEWRSFFCLLLLVWQLVVSRVSRLGTRKTRVLARRRFGSLLWT